MGYGLDTTKHTTRKWGATITWSGEEKGKLAEALAVWQAKVGVTFQKTDGAADFAVVWNDTQCQWSNSSAGNGKPEASKAGKLYLKPASTLGTVLHEIGHLLGLSHEQDRQEGWKWMEDNKVPFGVEGAKTRAADNKSYGTYEPGSIMHYPGSHYEPMTEPTAGDIAAVKAINGWK